MTARIDPSLSSSSRTAEPTLVERFREVRARTEALCRPLAVEDYVVQSMPEASPAKWHLAHTSWFFETFVLEQGEDGYKPFQPFYRYLFNSYYNTVGPMHERPHRGLITRPTVDEVRAYREHVDRHLIGFLERGHPERVAELHPVIVVGLHHEQQHQELLLTDLKHLFSMNPLRPVYRETPPGDAAPVPALKWLGFEEGLREIGFTGSGFAYDNETPRHREFVPAFRMADRLITAGEYLEFMEDGGYERPDLWLSDGWAVVTDEGWRAPLYWERSGDRWRQFTLAGLREVRPGEPVCHVSYYEADAYARWAEARLPTEAEWEIAADGAPIRGNFIESDHLHPAPLGDRGGAAVHGATDPAGSSEPPAPAQLFGDAWEWTESPYSPYPGYRPPAGALGEYNGKFMINQMVLRGGSCFTPVSHIRPTYRNFFSPRTRWQVSGIRLARDV